MITWYTSFEADLKGFQAMGTWDNAGGSRMIGSAVDPPQDGWPMGVKKPA